MKARRLLEAALSAAVVVTLTAGVAAAQLPFDVTQEDLAGVDTTAMKWSAVSTSVGGVNGELRYISAEVTPAACQAVALLGMLRLRNYYMRQEGGTPVSMRMTLLCGPTYVGYLDYDGIIVSLDLRDRESGQLVYQGRRRGLP